MQAYIVKMLAGENMNRLPLNKQTAVIAALVEGAAINATCRMTGVAKHTVLNLLRDLGCAAAKYHHHNVRGVRVKRLQCDEIWSFVARREKMSASKKRNKDGATFGRGPQ